jgi:hypothetical protein
VRGGVGGGLGGAGVLEGGDGYSTSQKIEETWERGDEGGERDKEWCICDHTESMA